MNLFIDHDAATIARLTGDPKPAFDRILLKHGDPADVLACVSEGNPLAPGWLLDLDAPGHRFVAWSGTLADDVFGLDPRTWMRPGREAFDAMCDELTNQLIAHDRVLCFHPHARHVLNDVPSCLGFIRQRCGVGKPFEVALAPHSMFEPSMLEQADEHLHRQFQALGEACSMVILSDVRVDAPDGMEPRCVPASLGDGVLPRDVVRTLLREHVPGETPIVIRAGHIDRQIEWLTG